jgi:Family of unknown function (DUF6493)
VVLDPQLLEAAVRRGDSAAVRDLLKDATESDRAACAKALKGFLTGPKWHAPDIVMLAPQQFMQFARSSYQDTPVALRLQEERAERNADYVKWLKVKSTTAFSLAALGLAGGVAAATRVAADLGPGQYPTPADVEQIATVLADRQPDWLAEFVDRQLQDQFGVLAWPLARALVRRGVIGRPSLPEYTTQMPGSAPWMAYTGRGHGRATPAQALLADPGLLEDEFWRLFTVPDAGHVLDQEDRKIRGWEEDERRGLQTWSKSIALLCAEGHLDRSRVIEACLDAFTRDFNPKWVGWYAETLTELVPSDAEIAARAEKYLQLLRSGSKFGVTLGQQGARTLLEAGQLDPGRFLAASAGALLFPQKNIAIAQLKLIGAVAKRYPALRPDAASTAALAFAHERQDIQEAALKLIGILGVPDGPHLAEIRMRASELSASLAAGASALGLLPDLAAGQLEDHLGAASVGEDIAGALADLENRIGAVPPGSREELYAALEIVRRGGVPGPARVQPAAGNMLPPPVTDPEELVQLLTVLIEDATDAIAAERALAGAVRLSLLPVRQRRQLAAPLLKRAQRVMDLNQPFSGSLITADMARIVTVWAGGKLRIHLGAREAGRWMPGQYAVGGSGQPLTMAGIFSARAWEAATIIEAGQGGVLLAEPETDRAAITASTLLHRSRQLADQGGHRGDALRHDSEQALLRLAPGVGDSELWAAWASAAGQSAATLRRSHETVQSPVSFEAVTGEPTGQPLRASQKWYTHVLARTRGPVPAAPGCECWQQLTALADPLREHEVLYGPSRYLGARQYDAAVAGWTLICPWQPEIAAAHLLRPLSDGLIPGITPATVAMTSMRHPGHALGPVGHLALVTGLASAEADTRIAAAELWSAAATDGRLDPALAAAAIVSGVRGDALKLSRIAQSLEQASHTELAARRVVETVCITFGELADAANMHVLIELAARLGSRTGLPELPAAVREMAVRRGSSRIIVTARQLAAAASSKAPARDRAAAQALTALVARAEARAGD